MIVKIPFQVIELEYHSYHMVVEGKINGTDITFIVDTGASRTIIDRCYAEKLIKIKSKLEEPIATGINAEQIPVELYKIPILKIEDASFKNIKSLTADLTAINEVYSKLTGKTIGGLIGCDFLLKHVIRINLKKKYLAVSIRKKKL